MVNNATVWQRRQCVDFVFDFVALERGMLKECWQPSKRFQLHLTRRPTHRNILRRAVSTIESGK